MHYSKIRTGLLSLALAALGITAGTGFVSAQSSTQGAISGTVQSSTGTPLSGADIVIHNLGTNAEVHLQSDNSGFYKAPLLEPGNYSVKVKDAGFAEYSASHVVVSVGSVTSVDPRLSISGDSVTVVVSEQVPVINSDSPDFSSTVNLEALQNIPINNRRWSSLAMMTPGVVSNSDGYGLVSVRGVSPILNNVEIDGADDNQAYYAEERGRTREAYSTSSAAVREFAVNTGVYSAEYGRAAGGVITSVTKSGSNQLHGEAYFFDRDSGWNAFNDYAKISTKSSTGSWISNPIKPKDLRKIYGFTASGAIIPDKLFWIYTYDQHSRVFPVIGVPSSASSFYATPDTLNANSECSNIGALSTTAAGVTSANSALDQQVCALAARQGITYSSAVTLYSTWITNLNSNLGLAPRTGYQEINTPKLDWQITPKEHWSVLYHRLRWDSPGGVQTAPTDNYSRDAQGTDYVKLDYGVTKLTSLITNNISNELLYQFGRELNNEGQQPYTDYTKNYLTVNGNVPQISLATSTNGFTMGSPYYSYRKALPDEHKWQIGDILYYSRGKHSFKFGLDVVHNYDQINNTYDGNGVYSYSLITNYINDQVNFQKGKTASTCDSSASGAISGTVKAVLGTSSCYSSFTQGFGSPIFSINTLDTGFFAQDNWKFSPRLTFELGLRADKEFLPAPVSRLTATATGFTPYAALNNNPQPNFSFGPRVGFAYDLTGNGKTVIRGGYGLYYGRINNGNLLNLRLGTGSPNGQYTTAYKAKVQTNTTTGVVTPAGPQFPYIETGSGVIAQPNSYFFDNNLKLPEVHEFDLMVQREVGHGTVAQISYLGGLGRRLPNFLNLNLTSKQNVAVTISDSTGLSPLSNNTVLSVPTYMSYGNTSLLGAAAAGYQGITDMVSNVNSNYHALVVEVQNRSLGWLQFDANYTWSHSMDFAQNSATTTSTNNWYDPFGSARQNYANSSFNVPNRFVAYANFRQPKIHIASKSLDYLVNGWSLNDSFWMQNGLPYSPAISMTSYTGMSSGLNGAGGASFIPTSYMAAGGLNRLRYPRRMSDDVRLQKDLTFSKYHVALMANAFNLANHQNVDGISNTMYKLSSATCTTAQTAAGYAGCSTLTYQSTYGQVTSSNNSSFLLTPRLIEIAARLTF